MLSSQLTIRDFRRPEEPAEFFCNLGGWMSSTWLIKGYPMVLIQEMAHKDRRFPIYPCHVPHEPPVSCDAVCVICGGRGWEYSYDRIQACWERSV